MSDESRGIMGRKMDLWIKIVVLISLPLNWGITWGLTQGQISSVKDSIAEVKGWIKAHDQYTMASIKETGEMLAQLRELNRSMDKIQKTVDERLHR